MAPRHQWWGVPGIKSMLATSRNQWRRRPARPASKQQRGPIEGGSPAGRRHGLDYLGPVAAPGRKGRFFPLSDLFPSPQQGGPMRMPRNPRQIPQQAQRPMAISGDPSAPGPPGSRAPHTKRPARKLMSRRRRAVVWVMFVLQAPRRARLTRPREVVKKVEAQPGGGDGCHRR